MSARVVRGRASSADILGRVVMPKESEVVAATVTAVRQRLVAFGDQDKFAARNQVLDNIERRNTMDK